MEGWFIRPTINKKYFTTAVQNRQKGLEENFQREKMVPSGRNFGPSTLILNHFCGGWLLSTVLYNTWHA